VVVAVGLEERVQAGERARERWFLVVDGRRVPSSNRSGLVSVSLRGLGSLGLARGRRRPGSIPCSGSWWQPSKTRSAFEPESGGSGALAGQAAGTWAGKPRCSTIRLETPPSSMNAITRMRDSSCSAARRA
jgi:hypothetical protein